MFKKELEVHVILEYDELTGMYRLVDKVFLEQFPDHYPKEKLTDPTGYGESFDDQGPLYSNWDDAFMGFIETVRDSA